MSAALIQRFAAKAALLLSSVIMLAGFAGFTSSDAKAASFSFGCSPAPCIHDTVWATMSVQCQTTVNNLNGTKTRRIIAWIMWGGLTPGRALDTSIAVTNSAGFTARYGPYRLGYGQAISLGSSTVVANAPALQVMVAAQFKLWANGVATTAPWELASHSTVWNGLSITIGSMSYCTLY